VQSFAAFSRSGVESVGGFDPAEHECCVARMGGENSIEFMGKRKEPRKEIKVPVRIFGTDSIGQIFSEKVFTSNVSRCGVELIGVQAQLTADEIVGLTYGTTKVHFCVKWVGQPNTPKAGHLGLLNLTPEKPLWDFALPEPDEDKTWRDARDRRRYPRVKCLCSVELHAPGQSAPMRVRSTDLSCGGCFVEMNPPLPEGTPLKIGLWLNQTKVSAEAKVITSSPGFGIGVEFTQVSPAEQELIRKFLQAHTRLPSI
jgi:hypothetical protein